MKQKAITCLVLASITLKESIRFRTLALRMVFRNENLYHHKCINFPWKKLKCWTARKNLETTWTCADKEVLFQINLSLLSDCCSLNVTY
jgi:hypothetical protein